MQKQTLLAAYGCLLHDFGKIVYRAGSGSGSHSYLGWKSLGELLTDAQWQPVLDCVRWHHAAELRRDRPSAENIAYIACVADNLSAAADRREIEGEGGTFVRNLPLSPIFGHMNGEHRGFSLPPSPQDGVLRMPQKDGEPVSVGRYADAEREIKAAFPGEKPEETWLNSLLALLESWTSSFPSSTFSGESPDISLYDHLKTTAAIGSCISEYLLSKGETDFRRRLFEEEDTFRQEPAFLLYSADLSGIQRFIYMVADAKALRSLRSRSFFLGLLMEHYVDEILSGCGLSRANLLYSGGGHCYLLLPNTPKTIDVLRDFNLKFNDFLLEEFGTSLFLAHGWTACCGNDLINFPREKAPYKEMFRQVSSAISAHKMHRYSVGQMIRLNSRESSGERECRICGRSDHLQEDFCTWCRTFIDLSVKIQSKDVYLVCDESTGNPDFALPSRDGTAYFTFTDEETARTRLQNDETIRRVYTKNKSCTGFRYSTKIYVGDYCFDNLMDNLSAQSKGIQRIGVCRMDVDNLGQAFVAGFELPDTENPTERYRYVTISRTSAFSRQMSLFFQLYINGILSGQYRNKKPLAVSVVYSGGDDVFLVGAWNDVIEAANRVQDAFSIYTCGALTISGGVGIFDDHYPIRAIAGQTAELEDRAKNEPEKNAVSFFDPREAHTYRWDVFRKKIWEEKVGLLESFFASTSERGNSFLYRLLELLRQSQTDGGRINLARYAYLLARLEPKQSSPQWKGYREFADRMYSWALDKTERQQLITAIYLYVYENRKV